MTDKMVVLIVDDDLTNRLVLKALLTESGYLTRDAENGKEAVDAVAEGGIDIVLLDVMMPVMDGYEAAGIIKKTTNYFIPIIFLTAMTDENSLANCIKSGGDDFLTKPYNHLLLRSKIDSMMRITQLYRKIEEQNEELNKHNARIQHEIKVAKKIFGNILDNDMRSPQTGLRYSMSPMSIFNGDMILAECNQTNGLDILISDFTGHGLSAAIGSIPVSDIFHAMTNKGFAFSETLTEINNKLYKLLPTQMFMACALISIDRNNNVVSIMNAGLPELYLLRNGEIIETIKSRNLPLGIAKTSHEKFEIDMFSIDYGDRIIAASDGLMEAQSKQGEFYGTERVLNSINSSKKPDSVFDKLLNDCQDFSRGQEQSDDITLLELHHLEKVGYKEENTSVKPIKPSEWSMKFSLDIESIKHFEMLPYIMQGVNSLQSIPNGRSTVHTILAEIYANALDHGILKLDSAMKDSPEGYMRFYQEKTERLESVVDGSIQIDVSHELKESGGGRLIINVVDSGDGFDYKNSAINLDTNKGYSGRGLALLNTLCNEVKYLGKGNAIMAVYDWE